MKNKAVENSKKEVIVCTKRKDYIHLLEENLELYRK